MPVHYDMVKGVTVTSSIITISGRTTEAAPGVFTEEEIPLSLDVLSREVLLVYAVDVNMDPPDAIAATDTPPRGPQSETFRQPTSLEWACCQYGL